MVKTRTDLPPLNWLKTFEAAARLLNFSAAGRELNMTQSAVSQQIRLLEHHLGEPLFTRSHRKVSLTNSGLAYLPVVQEAITGLQRNTAEIFSPVGKGHLVLEVSIAFAMLWLAPRLNKFCARYPGLTLRLVHANWESEFDNSGSDLSIMHGKGDWQGMHTEALFSPILKPYCSSRLARFVSDRDDLLSLPLLDVIGTRQGWTDWFRQAGLTPTGEVLKHKVDNVAMAYQMAEAGLGAFLCHEDFVIRSRMRHHLQTPIDIQLETEDNYYLTYPEGRPLSKSATVFRDWLLDELAGG